MSVDGDSVANDALSSESGDDASLSPQINMTASFSPQMIGPPLLKVTAPGKVILFGEHSVLYQRLAVAAAVGLRTRLTLHNTAADQWCSLNLPDIGLRRAWRTCDVRRWFAPLLATQHWSRPQLAGRQLRQQLLDTVRQNVSDLSAKHSLALVSFFYLYGSLCPAFPGVHVHVHSQLPTGAGLGSSAAYSVALVTALLFRYHQGAAPVSTASSDVTDDVTQQTSQADGDDEIDDIRRKERPRLTSGREVQRPDASTRRIISDWALASDDIIHGQASGVDSAICTQGGAITFRGGKVQPLETAQTLQVLLVDTCVTRDTHQLVQLVRQRLSDRQLGSLTSSLLDSLQLLAEAGCCALQNGDRQLLAKLVAANHGLLQALGVSHPSLNAVCATAGRLGMAAKLTGAGGGGFAIVLVPCDPDSTTMCQLKQELQQMNCVVYDVEIGGPGVTVQSIET